MRSGISISLMTLTLTAVLATSVLAAPGDGANRFPWEGEISGMNVYIRSGPGINYYPTTKLNAGDRVLVLGEKFGWYQIVPPPQSFSYVDAAKVQRKSGAKTGTVMQDRVYVRAGSHLVQRKTSTQLVLNRGSTVEIIGDADGFYKIVPPRGAGLYITKKYVAVVPARMRTGLIERYLSHGGATKKTTASEAATSPKPIIRTSPPPKDSPVTALDASPSPKENKEATVNVARDDASPLSADSALTSSVETEAAAVPDETTASISHEPPADQPASATPNTSGRYQALLTVVESELRAMLERPLAEQNLDSLLPRFEEIAGQTEDNLSSRVAQIRMGQLRDLIDMRAARSNIRTNVEELDAFRARMTAERMRIMRQRAEATLAKFDLEGELRRSYAYAPEKRRYRLVDPEKQTTIAYVDIPRSVEDDVNRMIGRVVGIHTAGQRYSTSARVPIAVAASITDLTPRPSYEPVINANQPSNAANTGAELAKSTEETARPDEDESPSDSHVAVVEPDAREDE